MVAFLCIFLQEGLLYVERLHSIHTKFTTIFVIDACCLCRVLHRLFSQQTSFLDDFMRRAVMLQISHSDPAIFSRRSDAGSSHLRHTNGAIRTSRARPSWRPPSSSFSLPLSRSAPCVCLSTEKGQIATRNVMLIPIVKALIRQLQREFGSR
jgi:hypothetical protein